MDDDVDGDDGAGHIEECHGRGGEGVMNVTEIGGWGMRGLEVVAC